MRAVNFHHFSTKQRTEEHGRQVRMTLSSVTLSALAIAVNSRLPKLIAEAAWKIPEVNGWLKAFYLKNIVSQCEDVAKFTRPHTPSLLRDKTFAAMKNFAFEKIIQEVEEKCPDLLDVVVSVCAPEKSLAKGVQQRIPAIGTIVGMLMHQHNRELNLVQRVNTILLAAGHAEKKVGPLFIRTIQIIAPLLLR